MKSNAEIRSKEITIVPLAEIKLNAKNRNRHPQDQIDRLAKLIQYQGFREPGIISNRSGVLIAGEGRYLAAKQLGIKAMPCIYQDFDSEEQEEAFGVSTNAIALWADLDLSAINMELPELGPDFDIDLMGIKGFELDPYLGEAVENPDPEELWQGLPEFNGPNARIRIVLSFESKEDRVFYANRVLKLSQDKMTDSKCWSIQIPKQ